MSGNKICPKCQGVMINGNYTGTVANWENEEEPSFLKKSGQKIIAYACEDCGYIESYVKK